MAHYTDTLTYCGCNADWCVDAWAIDGDLQSPVATFLLDNEDDTCSIVRRTLTDDGEHTYETLYDRMHLSDDTTINAAIVAVRTTI